MLKKVLFASAGAAAMIAAAPAAAQQPNPYGYYSYGVAPGNAVPYRYGTPQNGYPYGWAYPGSTDRYNGYSYQNGYGYNAYNNYYNRTAYAQQQCSSTVQARLQNRNDIPATVSALLGGYGSPRITSITQARINKSGSVTVKGLAASNGYLGQYGYGAYGALGYGSNPDLEFRCTVSQNGNVTNVDIRKR